MFSTDVFVGANTLHRKLGVELEPYRDYVRKPFQQMIRQGLPVAAIDTLTDELVRCLALSDDTKQPAGDVDRYPVFAPLAALATELDR